MKRTRRIGLTGPFSDVNFGDYAMMVNNIYDFGVEDICLFSYDSDFMTRIICDYLEDYRIDIVDIELEMKQPQTGDYSFVPLDLLEMLSNYELICEAIQSIDVLVVNGGGFLNGLWSQPHRISRLIKILLPVLLADKYGKKIVFTGNSYGPFDSYERFFSSFFASLKRAVFGCRDNLYSPFWLRSVGADDRQIRYVPDDLLFTNSKFADFEEPDQSTLLKDDYIVVESYLPLEYFVENIQAVTEFSEGLFRKYGLKIVFLPFNMGRGGLDQGNYLRSALSNYELFDIADKGYLAVQDALLILQNAKLVVSTRYHALVLSVANRIPCISFLRSVMGDKRYYYNKCNGLLRMVFEGVDYDERVFMKSDYLKALDSVLKDYNSIISKQREYFENFEFSTNLAKIKRNRERLIEEEILTFE